MATFFAGGRTHSGGNYKGTLAKFNKSGSLFLAFGTGGKISDVFGGTNDEVHAVGVDSQGRVLAGGRYAGNDALTRFLKDGTIDTSFGTGGKVTGTFTSGAEILCLAIQSDDMIVVGTDDNSIARFDTDGSLDTAFGSDGKVLDIWKATSEVGTAAVVNAIAIQGDGKIVGGGTFTASAGAYGGTGSVTWASLIRLATDGTRDTGFGVADQDAVNWGIAVDDFV